MFFHLEIEIVLPIVMLTVIGLLALPVIQPYRKIVLMLRLGQSALLALVVGGMVVLLRPEWVDVATQSVLPRLDVLLGSAPLWGWPMSIPAVAFLLLLSTTLLDAFRQAVRPGPMMVTAPANRRATRKNARQDRRRSARTDARGGVELGELLA